MGDRFKIVLLGDAGTGKSAITVMFLQGKFIHKYDPTLEETYRKTIEIENKSCLLDILDTAGQESYHTMESRYVRNGDGFLIVYSTTSKSSFEKIEAFYDLVLRVKDCSSYPIVLMGNKCDLVDEREVSTEDAKKLTEKLSCQFLETSALKNENIKESFSALVLQLRKKWEEEGLNKKKKKKRCTIL
ncbi:ras-like protein [Anaeramoeba flamelloides]|uniref:Ras-like protein n=1 Tax=Anaeramoeba flamelloides TaxID=1746091 RepID=A0AAV7Z471_9EUKA|nr:ras-like protein [Anaeramoeba flamelloides]